MDPHLHAQVNTLPVRSGYTPYQVGVDDICNYEFRYQYDGWIDSWLDRNTIAALQSSAIWMDDDSFIKPLSFASLGDLNQWRETLSEKLESATSIVVFEGSIDANLLDKFPDSEWTYRLEDAISVIFPLAASGALATFESVYRSGELVYTSCVEHVSRFFERTYSLAQQLRNVGSLIVTRVRSRRGLADTLGIFLNE